MLGRLHVKSEIGGGLVMLPGTDDELVAETLGRRTGRGCSARCSQVQDGVSGQLGRESVFQCGTVGNFLRVCWMKRESMDGVLRHCWMSWRQRLVSSLAKRNSGTQEVSGGTCGHTDFLCEIWQKKASCGTWRRSRRLEEQGLGSEGMGELAEEIVNKGMASKQETLWWTSTYAKEVEGPMVIEGEVRLVGIQTHQKGMGRVRLG